MATLFLYVLGPLDMRNGDQPLPRPPTLKSRSLLAYLALHRNRPQPRDRLVGLFWAERPERKARRSLSTALWHIRRCLPDSSLLLSDAQVAQFDPRCDLWLDAEEFQALAARGDTAALQAALALYRGDLLDGFYDDWILDERYRLEALFFDVLTRLMVRHEAAGDHQAALAVARRLLARDPLREDAHRLAMRAYCRLGRRNAALEQYDRCRDVVRTDLGVEPMAETTTLYHAIQAGHLAATPGPRAPSPVVPAGVPAGRSPLDVIAPVRLVGRERELAVLADAWQVARAGRAGLALVGGEAGVGKTRLVLEFANRLRGQGALVLWGRCYEFERSLPYQPLAEALRALAGEEPAGLTPWARHEVARLLPGLFEGPVLSEAEGPVLSEAEGDPGPAPGLDHEQARLFEAVTCLLAGWSSRRALLVVLDDLHWAGESTLGLVHHLARHLAGRPVLIVGTFRPEAISLCHPLSALRRRLARDGLAWPLHLSRLSPSAVETMIVEMSGDGPAVRPLAARLYHETEGNPFFLIEIVKALFETGVVRLEAGAWQGDLARISAGALPLPPSLSEAILSRVQRLEEGVQDTLRLAAVLGREFDFDLLNAVLGRGEEATLEALDALLRRRLIEETADPGDGDFAFTHHKIQEVVYQALPRPRRLHWHARVGTAMETLYAADLEARAGELAHHFERARALDPTLAARAIHYLKEAGDRARRAHAHQDALDYYRRALALLEEVPPDRAREQGRFEIEAQLHEARAGVLEMIGRHDEAGDAYRRALARVPENDVIRRSHLYRSLGKSYEVPLCFDQAAHAYDLAESVLGPEPSGSDVRRWQAWIDVRVDRMWLCYWQHDVDRMAELAEQARPPVEQYGTPVQRARFFQTLVMMNQTRDCLRPTRETIDLAAASLSASRASDNPALVALAQFTLGCTLLWSGDLQEAEDTLRAALLLAERTGDVVLQARCLSFLTVAGRRRGQVEEVRRAIPPGLAVARTAGVSQCVGTARANMAWIAWREGALAEAEAHGLAALETWKQCPAFPLKWTALWPLTGIALARQRVGEAIEFVRVLIDPLQQRPPEELSNVLAAALDAWDRGQADLARQHLGQAARVATGLGYL